jgi:hypothetical protein
MGCELTRFIIIDTNPLKSGSSNSTIIGEILPNQAQQFCLPTDAQIQVQVIANSCANVIMKLKPGASNRFFNDYKFEYEFPYKLYHIPDSVEDIGRSFRLGVNYTIRATPEFRRRNAITAYFLFHQTCSNNKNIVADSGDGGGGDRRHFIRQRRRRTVAISTTKNQ